MRPPPNFWIDTYAKKSRRLWRIVGEKRKSLSLLAVYFGKARLADHFGLGIEEDPGGISPALPASFRLVAVMNARLTVFGYGRLAKTRN